MATGSATDGRTPVIGRLKALRERLRRVIRAMVFAPGRSTAMALVAVPYLWLGYYMVGTAFGLRGDPIIAGDWLTLVFTTYALFASLALAHRILRIGLVGMTEEYLIDAVVLTWLTAFYFVWMLARGSVDESTAAAELYGPVVAGEPTAVAWASVLGITAVVVAGLIHRPDPERKLFVSEFRTALVTLPALVTALVLLFRPGPMSVLWPVVGGIFVGTLVGGLTRVQSLASGVAKGLFAIASLAVWVVGALAWMVAHRRRPPNSHVILSHVQFGGGAERTDGEGQSHSEGPPRLEMDSNADDYR